MESVFTSFGQNQASCHSPSVTVIEMESEAKVRRQSVAIIGATPAGLMAGYLLGANGWEVTIYEADPEQPGGAARQLVHNGYRIDPLGERFSAVSPEVARLWQAVLPGELHERPPQGRIYQRRRLHPSPVDPAEAIQCLNVADYGRCLLSWLRMQIHPAKSGDDFDTWGRNQYGHHFFNLFLAPHLDKVWGGTSREFPAAWVDRTLPADRARTGAFYYPKHGPAAFWETCAREITRQGGVIALGQKVSRLLYDANCRRWLVETAQTDGAPPQEVDELISTEPMPTVLPLLRPTVDDPLIRAASRFRFRDLVLAVVMVPEEGRFRGTHLDVYDPSLRVARVLHYNEWSSAMVPMPGVSCFGLQYFGKADDAYWISRDENFLERAMRDLCRLGLAAPGRMIDGCVVRKRNVLAVHDRAQMEANHLIRKNLQAEYPRFHVLDPHCGRWDDGQAQLMGEVLKTVGAIHPGFKIPAPTHNQRKVTS